jgi:hypothetical protein
MDSEDNRHSFRAPVVRAVVDSIEARKIGSEYMKSICEVSNTTVDEILSYNNIMEYIERNKMTLQMTTGNCIVSGVLLLIEANFDHLNLIKEVNLQNSSRVGTWGDHI